MNLNLFGNGTDDDNDENQYSRFIKKETYDQLLITFNAVTAGVKKPENANANTGNKGEADTKPNPSTITVLTKTMVSSSRETDSQRQYAQTQNSFGSGSGSGSCDLVYVPTSFVMEKDKLEAFYESKKMKTDAAASVFMQLGMFEQFMKFAKKNARMRELALIEQSYNAAIKRFPGLIDGMNSVRNLADLRVVSPIIPANLNERFTILYTTPTVLELVFLPLETDFAAGGKFGVVIDASGHRPAAITQKALTYFCNYFQYLYMKRITIGSSVPTPYSVGRIPTYLPALNSNIGNDTLATNVHFKDVVAAADDVAAAASPSSASSELSSSFLADTTMVFVAASGFVVERVPLLRFLLGEVMSSSLAPDSSISSSASDSLES